MIIGANEGQPPFPSTISSEYTEGFNTALKANHASTDTTIP